MSYLPLFIAPVLGGSGPPPPVNTEAPFIQKDVPNVGFVSVTNTGSWNPEYNGFDPIEGVWYDGDTAIATGLSYEYNTPIGANVHCKVRVQIGGVWSAWAESNHLIL